jgi:hypothetical protein
VQLERGLLERLVMTKSPRCLLQLLLPFASLTTAGLATAAPSGPHPRLWLDTETRAGLAAQADVAGSPVARGAARCEAAQNDPSDYDVGGWQGFEFVTTLSGCLVSWAATGSAAHLETAIKYWNVLLDDYQTVGDGAGGDDVVTHDTGYAMRTFAPYSAIAYDWLHDAPGVTEELRAHARARFAAWIDYYSSSGYLRDMPGANYQAGYLFASTLIAVAEAGEAGAAGDAHWSTVVDSIWAEDMAPALAQGGVLVGGDWPEGWQYGDLSVLEYALAARALVDSGEELPGVAAWTDALVLRFAHGLTPLTRQVYTAGDTDYESVNLQPGNGPLLAAIAGPGGEQARAWARKLNRDLELENENPLFDALALARAGGEAALPADLPTHHYADGTGNFYARGSWTEETVWSVFQCSRRVVDDHQHNNAGNWVLSRGPDDLVVDPSPYGTLSTLTGNAPAVDTNTLPSGYSPSQGYWGEDTHMTWARQVKSGIAAARCDYADQFRRSDVPSDVQVALRDYVLVPDGDAGAVVLVDRVVTGDSARSAHLRVRTPGELGLSDDHATAVLGESALDIERVWSSSGTPNVREMPQASECPSSDHTCDVSRIAAGTEYRIDLDGPSALAIHVVTARPAQAAAPSTELLSGAGYRGALVRQNGASVAVVTNDAADGARQSALSYAAPAGELVHVVLDAPVDDGGRSDVTAALEGGNCVVAVVRHAGAGEGFEGAPLIFSTTADCTVSEDGSQAEPPIEPPPVSGEGGAPAGVGGQAAEMGGEGTVESSGGSGARPSGTAGTATGSGGSSSQPATGGSTASMGTGAAGEHPTIDDVILPPVTPPLGACSFSARGSRGSAGLLAGAVFGLWLAGRHRRRGGAH